MAISCTHISYEISHFSTHTSSTFGTVYCAQTASSIEIITNKLDDNVAVSCGCRTGFAQSSFNFCVI